MSTIAPTIKLNNGQNMPVLGLGTYLSKEDDGIQSVKDAINAGYRHIDTAYFYENEKQVGIAVRDKIKEGVVKREDMFIVTKLWNTYHNPDLVAQAFQKSLDNLGLDYIDLYLMHTPMGYKLNAEDSLMPLDSDGNIEFTDYDYVDTWKSMEKLVETGKVKSLGISNFNSEQITRLLQSVTIKPVTNQVECNPGLNQKKLIEFCKQNEIVLTSYSPLGRPHYYEQDKTLPKSALLDDRCKNIAKNYNKSPGQIILKYLIQIGTVPIPKSSNKGRIEQNINLFDFELTEDEVKTMDSFNTGERTVPFKLCLKHKYFPFNIEF
uniref:Putative aldo/keto reductase family n=1 Tax=Corethrella appendiculata TaxID=1370023 RepID=U5EY15_9DIPT